METFSYFPTRYYFHRLWKISWVAVRIGHCRLRLVKHYERRVAVGQPWVRIRSIIAEVSDEHSRTRRTA